MASLEEQDLGEGTSGQNGVTCPICDVFFNRKSNYMRHRTMGRCGKNAGRKRKHEEVAQAKFPCPQCGTQFSRKDNLKTHIKKKHSDTVCLYPCAICQGAFFRSDYLLHRHMQDIHPSITDFTPENSAHGRACEQHRLYLPLGMHSVTESLDFVREKFIEFMLREKMLRKHFKASVTLHVRYVKGDKDDGKATSIFPQEMTMNFTPPNLYMTAGLDTTESRDELECAWEEIKQDIEGRVDNFHENGSNWQMDCPLWFDVRLYDCAPLAGGCGYHEVDFVRGRRTKQFRFWHRTQDSSSAKDDNRCFYRAVARHFCKEGEDLESFISANMNESVPVPVTIKNICKFEEENKHLSLAVNVVYADENNHVFPTYASKRRNVENEIVLMLFYSEGDEECGTKHYAYVPDLGSFLTKKEGKEKKKSRRQFFCLNCFNGFSRETALENHKNWCLKQEAQRVEPPDKGEFTKFDTARCV